MQRPRPIIYLSVLGIVVLKSPPLGAGRVAYGRARQTGEIGSSGHQGALRRRHLETGGNSLRTMRVTK